MDNATERAGMLLVQVERFMRVLASVVQQVIVYLLTTLVVLFSRVGACLLLVFSAIFLVVKNQFSFILPVRDYNMLSRDF